MFTLKKIIIFVCFLLPFISEAIKPETIELKAIEPEAVQIGMPEPSDPCHNSIISFKKTSNLNFSFQRRNLSDKDIQDLIDLATTKLFKTEFRTTGELDLQWKNKILENASKMSPSQTVTIIHNITELYKYSNSRANVSQLIEKFLQSLLQETIPNLETFDKYQLIDILWPFRYLSIKVQPEIMTTSKSEIIPTSESEIAATSGSKLDPDIDFVKTWNKVAKRKKYTPDEISYLRQLFKDLKITSEYNYKNGALNGGG